MKIVYVVSILVFIGLFISTASATSNENPDIAFALALCPDGVNEALPSHDPIVINSNGDFFVGQNGVTNGSGTSDDPFIIENWEISSISSAGIIIRNTDVYFIVRNTNVIGNESKSNVGIELHNVTNGRIEACRMASNYIGIWFNWSCTNNIIEENEIVYNNKINGAGIFIAFSDNNQFTHNNVSGNAIGVYVASSDNNTLLNNTINNNDLHGLFLSYSCNNTMKNNTLVSNRIVNLYLHFNCCNNTVENNTVSTVTEIDGASLLLAEDTSHNVIRGNNISNSPSGTSLFTSDNNSIENNIFYNNGVGINLNYSSVDNTITGNNFSLNGHGMVIYQSNHNSIDDNILYNNVVGINLNHSSIENTITDNNFSLNSHGIVIYQSSNNSMNLNNFSDANSIFIYHSSNNSISTNYCNLIYNEDSSYTKFINNNARAVMVKSSQYAIINKNYLRETAEFGVSLQWVYYSNVSYNYLCGSITFSYVQNNDVVNNVVMGGILPHKAYYNDIIGNSFKYSIQMSETDYNNFLFNSFNDSLNVLVSDRNIFAYNNFTNIGDLAINFGDTSVYNRIYYNNFINNNNGQTQASDKSGMNFWNNTYGPGNFWSDWTSPDSDQNGIVDNPYGLWGGKGSKDNYPLTNPVAEAGTRVPDLPLSPIALIVTLLSFLVVIKRIKIES